MHDNKNNQTEKTENLSSLKSPGFTMPDPSCFDRKSLLILSLRNLANERTTTPNIAGYDLRGEKRKH